MTGQSKSDRDALLRLADALTEDTLNMSDEEVLAEVKEDSFDADRYAADMCERFKKELIVSNKKRLFEAKAGVASMRGAGAGSASVTNIATARVRLHTLLNNPELARTLTLAARNEGELSDADVLSMLDDLRELGVFPSEGNGPGED